MTYHSDLIEFFKRHNMYNKEMFDYFSFNTIMIDYKDEEQRALPKCFYTKDKSNRITNIYMYLPYIYDDVTMLVSIHIITQAILLYSQLNKKIKPDFDLNTLPMLYEWIYAKEKNNPELFKYIDYLDSFISDEDVDYCKSLAVREELYDSYNQNFNKMNKMSKKLIKKKINN